VNYAEVLEKYLYRIARGELRDLDPLIPLIPPSILFMPVISESSEGKKTNITLPIIERLNKKYLPIFLRKSHLLASYEKLKVSSQEIKGETLLEVLPTTLGLLFEPNSSLEVTFSREDLGLDINELEKEDNGDKLPLEAYEPALPSALEDLFSGNQQKVTPLVEVKRLEEELKIELIQYGEVLEAFFIPHTSSYSDAILGLLREEMDDERRYDLSESEHQKTLNNWSKSLQENGLIFIDLLNRNYILNGLQPYTGSRFKGYTIEQHRKVSTDTKRVEKLILIDSGSEKRSFKESVRLFSLEELTTMLLLAGLRIIEIKGCYLGSDYTNTSERLIILAQKT